MSRSLTTTYGRYVAFKATDDLVERLDSFARVLGRQRSDVIRHLLGACIAAYGADQKAIQKLRGQLH
jgi:predicted transcriptional regulator